MDSSDPKTRQNPPLKNHKHSLAPQICLRILAAVVSLTAASIVITDEQTITISDIKLEARFSYSSAFKYFAAAHIIGCVSSVIALIVAIVYGRKPSLSNIYFFMFLHDPGVMVMLIGASAAATAIGFMALYGNNHIGWFAICDSFTKFCDKIIVTIILSYFSSVFYLLLTILSAKIHCTLQLMVSSEVMI